MILRPSSRQHPHRCLPELTPAVVATGGGGEPWTRTCGDADPLLLITTCTVGACMVLISEDLALQYGNESSEPLRCNANKARKGLERSYF